MPKASKGSIRIKVYARKGPAAMKKATGEVPEAMQAMAKKGKWDRWEIQEREFTSDHLVLCMRVKRHLEGFEKMAMAHLLDSKNLKQMSKRAQEVKKHIDRIAGQVFKMGAGLDCPPPLCPCNGSCVECPCDEPPPPPGP